MKRLALATALTAMLLGVGGNALADKQMIKCAKTGDNAARLACWDRLSKKRGLIPKEGRDSAWIVQEEAAADGGKNVFLHLRATKEITVGWESAWPKLWITCAGKVANIYLDMGVFLHTERIRITSGLDRQSAITENYTVSEDGKIAFLAIGPGAALVAKSMGGRQKLSVRLQPYQQKKLNVEFQLDGLDQALPPLAEACGW